MWPFRSKPQAPRNPPCPYCGSRVKPVLLVTIRCDAGEDLNRRERDRSAEADYYCDAHGIPCYFILKRQPKPEPVDEFGELAAV